MNDDRLAVYLDGVKVADVDAATGTFELRGLTPGRTYHIGVLSLTRP